MTGNELGQRSEANDEPVSIMPQGLKSGSGKAKGTYQQSRPHIRTGDLLLMRGDRFLSSVIRGLSASRYSHCALLAKTDGRIIAFQSDHRGVEILPASRLVCGYRGQVDWYPMTSEGRDLLVNANDVDKERHERTKDPEGRSLVDAAFSLLGIKFGYWELFKLGLRIALQRPFKGKDAGVEPTSLFCSQFMSRIYRQATAGDLDVNDERSDIETSPGDFVNTRFFKFGSQLFDGSNGQACSAVFEREPAKRKKKDKGKTISKTDWGVSTWTGTHAIRPVTKRRP
jgi:hypothetical protein